MTFYEVRTPWKPLKTPLENLNEKGTKTPWKNKAWTPLPWKSLSIPLLGLKME